MRFVVSPVVLAGFFWSLSLAAATSATAQTPNQDSHQRVGQPQATSSAAEELVVFADSSVVGRLSDLGSSSILSEEIVDATGAVHVHEALVRVPGVWVSRGSGFEHLTAIRSAVFTGAGACGEFLFLEDGIPVRPAGFCNTNNLFEINTEQAGAIEVLRGPASAVLGGNALHGAVNVRSRIPQQQRLTVTGGPYDYYQVAGNARFESGDHVLGISANSVSSNGYRDDTGYGQQKFTVVHDFLGSAWQVRNTISGSLLNQETGGFVRGFEAYDDPRLRRTNPNPEAYRDAWSLRAASHWQRERLSITPYIRRSKMAFLQHFLPGQPLETNSQTSGGVMLGFALERDALTVDFGAQLEFMEGSLRQFQANPTVGSAFLVGTRPSGLHYDYDVDSVLAAAHYNLQWQFTDRARLIQSLRVERLSYDYDNKTLTGNSRDDGSACGFGGCLYTRPPSSDDDFTNVAGRLGIEMDVWDAAVAYALVGLGFRPPQATELYRLQNGQTITDLDSEEVLSVEVGLRQEMATGLPADGQSVRWSTALFAERSKNFILRDSEGFNVSDGRTNSFGLELSIEADLNQRHSFDLALSYAEHRYDFDRAAGGRETIVDGNLIDTAPRWLGSGRWRFNPSDKLSSELEFVYNGSHYVNAANTADYNGHIIFNWRVQYQMNSSLQLFARLQNLTDERYADRADFAFGSYRYFPGLPRQLYVGASYVFR